MDELEVERLELHLIPVHGRRGDPTKRVRTVEERVTLEIGPYWVTGNLHRMPTTQALAALTKRTRFVPLTEAIVVMRDRPDEAPMEEEVVLVNLDRVGRTETISLVPVMADDWPRGRDGGTGGRLTLALPSRVPARGGPTPPIRGPAPPRP